MVGRQPGILEVACKFALISLHALCEGGLLLRLFAEHRLANDALDIGVGQLNTDEETSLKAL